MGGNAMTVPVVGAVILCAIVAGYELFGQGTQQEPPRPGLDMHDVVNEDTLVFDTFSLTTYASLDVHTAIYLATSTARLCVCEGRQSNKRAKFQKCKVCGHSTCTDCGGNPEHQYQPIVLARGDPYNYQQLLKESLPMLITFVNLCSSDPSSFLDGLYNEHQERIDAERWLMIKPALVGALSHEVCFRSIMRRVEWEILYDSQYAVLRLTISAHGVSWRLFAKADPESAVNDPARKYLEEFPFASSHPEEGDIVEGPWEFWLPQELKVPATITGVGKLRQSYATKVGLTLHLSTYILSAYLVEAVKSLPGAKSEEWEGLYQSHPECGQAFDSLHVQVASSPLPRPLYFFLDHHRMAGDPKDHQYVFTHDTKRSKYGEARERRARLESWRPQVFHGLPMPPTESMTYKPVKSESTERFTESKLLEVIKPEHVNVVMDGTWTSIPNTLKCSTVENKFRFGHLPADPGNFDSCGLKYVIFDCQAPIGAHLAGSWPREEWFSVNSFNEDRFFKEFLWVFQRALYNPQHQEDGPFHQLDVAIVDYADCAPSPPTRKWAIGTDGKLVPFEDPEEAAQYERVMKRQARPINLYAKIDEKGLFNFKVAITPAILCQKSRATLGGRNTKIDKCEWRLTTDHNRERVEKSENFTYTDTTDELLAPEPLVWTEDPKLRLKDVQRRILSWTTGMETRPKIFREQHRHEARHDQTGTRLDGQITIYKTIRSIIVSFSAGGGKTPLSLAHIIIMRDRISPLKQRPGFISITATIIFVPTHLTKQWLSEIKKFLPTLYAEHGKVILLETMADLLNTTVGDFMKAEIIIVNIKLLADDDYLLRLATFSGVMPCSDKAGTRATEDWYLDALRNLNDSVEQLKKDPSDFQKYAETKYATSKAKFEKVVAFAASMRLRGKAYMKEKNKRKQLPKQEKEKVVKEAKPRPKIESGLANLESLKGPPLQMFFYQRLIHDEFTYTKGISYLAIRHAEAVFKMHLSATPDCSTPAAVNTYSLLGGITVCPISFETLQKQDELTQAEIFLGKGPEKSAAMQAFYHTKSQEFIDLCMRVDVVDKSEQTWKIKEQELMVHMRPSERLTYQEIVQSLNDARFQLALTNSPTDLHSVRQIYNAIGRPGISNQRKALVSTSAYSMLRLRRGSRLYDKEDALLSIERLRQRELEDLLNDLQSDMFDALVLHSDNATHSSLQDKDDPHRAATRYQNHSDCQDPDADKFFKEAIISAWHRFTDEGPHFGTKFKDWDTEEKVKAIKQAMSRIQGKVDRVRDAVRSHRIFFNGHLMERAQSNLSIEGLCVCSKCGRDLMDASPHLQYRLLTACGHLVCVECLNRSFEEIKDCCPVDNCRLINEAYQQLSSLRAPHNTVKDSHEPCSPTVIEIVKTIIQFPEGDNVVIFAQFPAQLSNVAHYLEPYGIVCWNLETARDPAGVLQAFQNRTEFVPGEGIARVLLLRIDDDTAAGGNITSANRIIFFAPYYTEGKGAQRLYDSAVRQALARVARTGQCKSKIFVYRFMAALTIEVDLFERRTHTRANYAPYRSGFADEFFDVEEAVEDVVDEVAMEN